jgi:hypothetical protein
VWLFACSLRGGVVAGQLLSSFSFDQSDEPEYMAANEHGTISRTSDVEHWGCDNEWLDAVISQQMVERCNCPDFNLPVNEP